MDKNLEKKLYQIDPIFFKEAIACETGEMNEMNTCMAFGCECGDGWFEPIKRFVEKTHILNEVGKQYNIQFICNQLKEKWGEIRIYSSKTKINPDEEFKAGYKTLDNMFDDALNTCEVECSKVCELCGASGGNNNENIVQTSGWISYICKKCAREITENETKHYDEYHKEDKFYGIDRITLFRCENTFMSIGHQCHFTYKENNYNSIIQAYFSEVDFENMSIYNSISSTKSVTAPYIILELAKKFGKSIDNIKLFKEIVEAKFHYYWNGTIRKDLLLTHDKMLINMNTYHDNVLGYCTCNACKDIEKQNILGKTLMKIREELKKNIHERFNTLEECKEFINEVKIDNLNIFKASHKKLSHLNKYYVSSKSNIEDKEWNFERIEK